MGWRSRSVMARRGVFFLVGCVGYVECLERGDGCEEAPSIVCKRGEFRSVWLQMVCGGSASRSLCLSVVYPP